MGVGHSATKGGKGTSRWINFILALFGTGLGVGALFIVWSFIRPSLPKGSEFESFKDLRAAMLQTTPAPQSRETRGATLNDIIDPHPDDRLIYLLRQNLSADFQLVPVTTNAARMRDEEVSIPRPANTYRIAFLGDSFTFGWGVAQSESFPEVLEHNLNRIADGKRRYEVLNFGVPGYSTFQELALYNEIGGDFRPDAVVVFFVENDFGLPFFIRNPGESGGFLSAFQFARLLGEGGETEHAAALNAQKRDIDDANANRALRKLALKTAEEGTKLFLVFNPKKNWKELAQKLWVLKEKNLNLTVLNIHRDLVRYTRRHNIEDARLSLPTDPHPSALKHRIIGDLLTPYFMESLP